MFKDTQNPKLKMTVSTKTYGENQTTAEASMMDSHDQPKVPAPLQEGRHSEEYLASIRTDQGGVDDHTEKGKVSHSFQSNEEDDANCIQALKAKNDTIIRSLHGVNKPSATEVRHSRILESQPKRGGCPCT